MASPVCKTPSFSPPHPQSGSISNREWEIRIQSESFGDLHPSRHRFYSEPFWGSARHRVRVHAWHLCSVSLCHLFLLPMPCRLGHCCSTADLDIRFLWCCQLTCPQESFGYLGHCGSIQTLRSLFPVLWRMSLTFSQGLHWVGGIFKEY